MITFLKNNYKILLIENREKHRNVIGKSLQNTGYNVIKTDDLRKGYEIYCDQKEEISIIVIGGIFPNEDCIKFCKRIRIIPNKQYVYCALAILIIQIK